MTNVILNRCAIFADFIYKYSVGASRNSNSVRVDYFKLTSATIYVNISDVGWNSINWIIFLLPQFWQCYS